MPRKKDPPNRKTAGPGASDSQSSRRSPRERAQDFKYRLETEGVAGVIQDLAPFLENLHKAATEAGTAAAAAGASAMEKAREALAGTACPKCGTRLPPLAKFCYDCGTSIPREKRCAKCDTALTASTKFCPECGTRA